MSHVSTLDVAEIAVLPLDRAAIAASVFDCGDEDLNDFLRTDAARLEDLGVARTHLAWRVDQLVGYVTLIADSVELQTRERKKLRLLHHDHPVVPAVKVARLAVATGHRNTFHGTGTLLMAFAYSQAILVSAQIGCRLLTVDAYPKAVSFYERLGFTRNKSQRSDDLQASVSMRLDLAAPAYPNWLNRPAVPRNPSA